MAVIQSAISLASDAFRANAERMNALVADISAKAAKVERGGSDDLYRPDACGGARGGQAAG